MPAFIFILFGLLLVLLVGGLFVLAMLSLVQSARGVSAELKLQGAAWRQMASSLGLQFEVYNPRIGAAINYEYPRLTGQYHGYPVRAEIVEERVGTTVRGVGPTGRFARIVLTLAPPAPGRLAISDHAFGFIGGFVLTKEIPNFVVTTGDAAFDQAFHVLSQPPAFGARLLGDGNLRQRLLSVAAWLSPGLELEPDELSFEHLSTGQDADYLPNILDVMIDLAKAVEHVG